MAREQGEILVVDDNRMNRLKLSLSLEQQGHRVGMAEDGEQALEMIREKPYDVVLLDIVMPRMDGYQVLERLKGDPKTRDIPVIVISALDELESAVRCIEAGAEDYLPKSFDPVLLKARLNASLQKKKLRDLEKAYLEQEVMLRQSEKLATLGRLSAGMAHELNNPAAAVQRGAGQLQAVFSRLRKADLQLTASGLSGEQVDALRGLGNLAQEKAVQPADMDPIARSDLERELEEWLERRGVENAWETAPNLVGLGYSVDDLNTLASSFPAGQFSAAIDWVSCTFVICGLLQEVREGAGRISEIVKALKGYAYMDQAPVQNVDVREGLESTLVMLRSKLNKGITVRREYVTDTPLIEAYGSELNQVWTNIIDNAIVAMKGQGELILRVRHDDRWVIVEIEDTGPGIPEQIQSRIFDPFFTTKAPGEGTGLGLNIVYNIVQKHKGTIDVQSRPGKTRFEVRLPLASRQPSENER